MKLQRISERKNGREYGRYRMLLTKKEGIRIGQAGVDWEIFDVDPKGELILHSPKSFEYHYSHSKEVVKTSFRLHVSKDDWVQFKHLVKSKGSSVCEVLSAFVRGVLVDEDSVLDRRVQLVFQYQGRPRGKGRSLINVTPSGPSGPITSQE